MKNRLISVFLMISISYFGVFVSLADAQQLEKKIAKNQAEQLKMELEMAKNEIMSVDSNAEKEYLDEQSQAQKEADMFQRQIDIDVELLLEQADQEAAQRRELIANEEQSQLKLAIQETQQQVAEIEEIDQKIKLDLLDQE